MVDPILGMRELESGSSLNFIRQNERNLVNAWFCMPTVQDDSLSTPPGSGITRGQAWIVASSPTGLWSTASEHDIAIALSDQPTSSDGWIFITPGAGARAYISAGTNTGHRIFVGSDWTTAA